MSDRHQMKRAIEKLKALYDRLPEIECQGKCWDYCTLIMMAGLEYKRFYDAGGRNANAEDSMLCAALDRKTRRCTVYSVRPFICRIYGVVKQLECPYGCVPERVMTDEEAYKLWQEVALISEESGVDGRLGYGTRIDLGTEAGRQELANFVAIDQITSVRAR